MCAICAVAAHVAHRMPTRSWVVSVAGWTVCLDHARRAGRRAQHVARLEDGRDAAIVTSVRVADALAEMLEDAANA
jgi:hypothetical protein